GLPPEPRFEGRSLVPAMQGSPASVDVIAELLRTGPNSRERHVRALVRGSVKLLVPWQPAPPLGDREVYDLARDPHESHPNPEELDGQADALLSALQAHLGALLARAGSAGPRVPQDAQTRERLHALGYVD